MYVNCKLIFLSLFISFILFISGSTWAASDELPFTYMNQYYNYEYIDSSSFNINNNTYNFDNFLVSKTNTGAQFIIKKLSSFNMRNPRLEILDIDKKLVKTLIFSALNDEFSKNLTLDQGKSAYICLISKNEFTTKKICRRIQDNESAPSPDLQIFANNVLLNPVGQIVLNDKEKDLVFRVVRNSDFFELITNRKNIIPNRAYKLANSNLMQVDFVELDQPAKFNFKAILNLVDDRFEIPIDDLINVYQDISFNANATFPKAIDYEFKDWKLRKYNKLGIEPIGLYSQIIVESTAVRAKIISDLSKGFKVYYSKYPREGFEYYYSGKLLLLQQRDDGNKNQITNKDLTLMAVEGGVRYYLTANFYYDLNVSLQELAYAEYDPNALAIEMVKAFTPTATAFVNYIVLELDKLRFQAIGGLGLNGPSGIPSGSTQIAFDINIGWQASYKMRGGRFYYGGNFSSFTANNSVYKFNYQALEHKIGFYYLY